MYCIVLTTTSKKAEARKIALGLLKEKLIACANILGPVESRFIWKRKLCVEKEFLLMMKTKEKLFSRVKKFILKNHSYEVPEIVLAPIKKGFEKYLRWIDEVVG